MAANRMNLAADRAAFSRYSRALVTQYKNRIRAYERNYSVEQVASLDNRLSWLLTAFAQSADCIEQAQAITDAAKLKQAEQLFAQLCIARLTQNPALLTNIAEQLQQQDKLSDRGMMQGVIEAMVFCAEQPGNEHWQAFLQPLADKPRQTLQLQLALNRTATQTPNWPGIAAELWVDEPLAQLVRWVTTPPCAAHWAELAAATAEQPDIVFLTYQCWGNDQALQAVINGLRTPRTNSAAYQAWLFLTDQPLPQIPALIDTSSGQVANEQTFACAETAQAKYDQLRSSAEQGIEATYVHIAKLLQRLHQQVSVWDDVYWLSAVTQLKITDPLPLIRAQNMTERQRLLRIASGHWQQGRYHEYT